MSTCIEVVAYDRNTRNLSVGFTDGSEYRYFGVEPETAKALTSHPSLGIAFNEMLRPEWSYKYLRVQRPEA